VEYCYGDLQTNPFPFNDYPTIDRLCLTVLRYFSKQMLQATRNSQRLGPSGRVRPPEACFHDEFYRCFFELTGSKVGISSEWSNTGTGRVDFYIIEPHLRIEFLRDSDRLQEHCGRFHDNGIYYPWMQRGNLNDWLMLDIRHSIPRATCKELFRIYLIFSLTASIFRSWRVKIMEGYLH
jgi:hypothetical protein